MTGGHGHFIGREADGADEVRKAVRTEIKAGAGFIKVMATGGVLTAGVAPTQHALLPEELAVVAEEAHNSGRRVSTHAIGNAGIRNALRRASTRSSTASTSTTDRSSWPWTEGTFLVPTLLAVVPDHGSRLAAGIPAWVVDKAEGSAQRQQGQFCRRGALRHEGRRRHRRGDAVQRRTPTSRSN